MELLLLLGLDMGRHGVLALGFWVSLLSFCCSIVAGRASVCPTAFWNFRDSLSDTGSASNLVPLFIDAERSPYGESFFGRPSKRFCNGRVVPDFFALAFRKPLLQPYVQAGAFNYKYGANFASSGATARNDTSINPLFLLFQISQYNRLRLTSTYQKQQHECVVFHPFLPRNDAYSKGLFTIQIGGNDILDAVLVKGTSAEDITQVVIPEAIANIEQGFENLYGAGARNFLFFNVPNAGCSTLALAAVGSILPLDSQGCVTLINELSLGFNAALNATISGLRLLHPQARISLFDYYAANEEILLNPTKYGFDLNLTKTACCGASGLGPLNYDPLVPCGAAGSNKCSNPDEHVNWDGVHFTEAFYRVIATFALKGQFTDQGVNYTANCKLDFRSFGPEATYDRVYGRTCATTFIPLD